MEKVCFNCHFDLADTMIAMLGNGIDDDYPVISAYGKYEVIRELLEDIIASGVHIYKSIELEDFKISNYDKEFSLDLYKDGVCVCKMWDENHYLIEKPDIAFVHEDCNSKMLEYIKSPLKYEYAICNEENCDDCDCNENEFWNCLHCGVLEETDSYCDDDFDDRMHEFTINKMDGDKYKSVSVYTTDKLSMADIQGLLQETGF